MPVTSAILNSRTDKISSVLADIEQQFNLDGDALISITSHFHKLFNIGLSEYGHPMAMMYVSIPPVRISCFPFTLNLSPTFVTGVPDGTETG